MADWTVAVQGGKRILVARGGADTSYAAAFQAGALHAEMGLDLLSVQGRGDLPIEYFDENHLVWWRDNRGLTLRLVEVSPISMHMSVTATVFDAKGKEKVAISPPELSWHESYRYFRLSQTTHDLFDAYRNAYLALESVLSDIAPQRMKGSKPAEGEGAWFKRALGEAARLLSLSPFVPAGASDPVGWLYKSLYEDTRSPMSHAKGGRRILLPRTETERREVEESLALVVRLYLALAQRRLLARRGGGGLTAAGANRASSVLDSAECYASEDESPEARSDTAINPAGGKVVRLPNSQAVDTGTPLLLTKLYHARAAQLRSLPFIRRVGAVVNGQAAVVNRLEERLYLGNAARFEVVLGIRFSNPQQARTRYTH